MQGSRAWGRSASEERRRAACRACEQLSLFIDAAQLEDAEARHPPRLAIRSSGPTGVASRSSAPDPSMSATCQRTPSTLRCSLRLTSSASSSSGWRLRCSRDKISCRPAARAGGGARRRAWAGQKTASHGEKGRWHKDLISS